MTFCVGRQSVDNLLVTGLSSLKPTNLSSVVLFIGGSSSREVSEGSLNTSKSVDFGQVILAVRWQSIGCFLVCTVALLETSNLRKSFVVRTSIEGLVDLMIINLGALELYDVINGLALIWTKSLKLPSNLSLMVQGSL